MNLENQIAKIKMIIDELLLNGVPESKIEMLIKYADELKNK